MSYAEITPIPHPPCPPHTLTLSQLDMLHVSLDTTRMMCHLGERCCDMAFMNLSLLGIKSSEFDDRQGRQRWEHFHAASRRTNDTSSWGKLMKAAKRKRSFHPLPKVVTLVTVGFVIVNYFGMLCWSVYKGEKSEKRTQRFGQSRWKKVFISINYWLVRLIAFLLVFGEISFRNRTWFYLRSFSALQQRTSWLSCEWRIFRNIH